MRFFFDPSVVEALTKIGFSHLSVANNHIFDQGRAGANDTFTNLTNAGIEAIGYRDGTTLGSIATTTLRGHDIAFIALDTTTTPHDLDDIEEELAPLGEDIFITSFLHWGNEYETVHSDEQEEFAHALIDRGVDLIIGAHPHVVQDIEEYNGARIYYSLGNFIFDQYWNESVRDGLMVLVTLDGDDTSFTDISITSDHSKSQPYIESIIAGE